MLWSLLALLYSGSRLSPPRAAEALSPRSGLCTHFRTTVLASLRAPVALLSTVYARGLPATGAVCVVGACTSTAYPTVRQASHGPTS